MFCKYCGMEIQEDWKMCPKCGASIENDEKTPVAVQQKKEKKKKPVFKRIWFWILIILIVAVLAILLFGGEGKDRDAEFGKPVTVDDVLSLTIDEGGLYDKIYPFNATDENTGIKYSGDGLMFGLYGTIENLSAKKIDVNEVCEAKLIIDGKYESDANIWLENEEQTVFSGLDLSDQVYLSPDAYMNAKEEFPCVVLGQVGNQVYEDAEEFVLELKILKDVDEPEEFVTFKMPLSITREESSAEQSTSEAATEPSSQAETTQAETTEAPQTTEAATEAPQTTEADVEVPTSDMQYLEYDPYKSCIGNGYSFGENSEYGFQILNVDNVEIGTVYIYTNGADMPDDYMYYDEVEQGSFDDYHWYTVYNTGNGQYLWVIEAHDMAATSAFLYLDTAYVEKMEDCGFSLELY